MPVKYQLHTVLCVMLIYACAPETRSIAQARHDQLSPQSFPLDQPGEHVFHFRQAQNGEMTLLLHVEGAGEQNRSELTGLRTILGVTLVDSVGQIVCQAVGSPKEGISTDSWVLGTSRGEAAFWHRGCSEVKLKRHKYYTLTVRLRDVDPNTPRIKVTPILEPSDNYGP